VVVVNISESFGKRDLFQDLLFPSLKQKTVFCRLISFPRPFLFHFAPFVIAISNRGVSQRSAELFAQYIRGMLGSIFIIFNLPLLLFSV